MIDDAYIRPQIPPFVKKYFGLGRQCKKNEKMLKSKTDFLLEIFCANVIIRRMRTKVLIYRDYGVSNLAHLTAELCAYFTPRGKMVDFTDAEAILKKDALDDSVALFVMPGGAATPFIQKLHTLGRQKINNYVQRGGHYLGVCAGAYYACTSVEFERDIPQLAVVTKDDLLNLIDSRAVGTLHKELSIYPYTNNADSGTTVCLKWQDEQTHYVHYHGGPKFLAENAQFEVLARYQDIPDNPPAIIAQNYGQGRVVLSAVHFENKGQDLQKILHGARGNIEKALHTAKILTQHEISRKLLATKIMSALER